MKRILYANRSVLTGDDVARSVVRYATALARAGSADSVTLPVIGEAGLATIEMVIGPASQLLVEDDSHPNLGFDGSAYAAEIDERCERMSHPTPIPASPETDDTLSHADDL